MTIHLFKTLVINNPSLRWKENQFSISMPASRAWSPPIPPHTHKQQLAKLHM